MTRSWPTLHAGCVEDHWAWQQRKGPGTTHAGEGLGFREWRSLPLMAQRRLIEAVEPSRCPLLTQSGHARLKIAAVQTSPWNPFRRSQIPAVIIGAVGVVLSLEEGDATTRFHQSRCLFSHYVAARGAGATS